MGVFLGHVLGLTHEHRLPHARGGVSLIALIRPNHLKSSPRPWGCFLESPSRLYRR
ncbi:hypothetical protein BMETH_321_8 [methanotrophic bacterial endosymbiont of Bathymodiolus sp.]|nr:hypothetical protein BMETH_321_8 [methanotrophic bacterial endosymbiont of Bathymodiolus sp.]